MKIIVIGSGAWGTALAISASRLKGNEVELWCRNEAQANETRRTRSNERYLPGSVLPHHLGLSGGEPRFREICQGVAADVLVIATPMSALREMLTGLSAQAVPVVWLCKGIENAPDDSVAGLMGHEIAEISSPHLSTGVLSGPSFAAEVAAGQPAALVAASTDVDLRSRLVAAFHGPALRIYANDDVVGVEVGGAVKNVLAIAAGLSDGLGLGLNARAGLITRGLAEMTRFGMALGARKETFMGLSGLGDLVLTATGGLSRNRQVGLALAHGSNLADAVASLGHVAEGVSCAKTVVRRAQSLGVEMPISECVVELLSGQIDAAAAVAMLMERSAVPETGMA